MGQNAGPDGRDAGRPLQSRSLRRDLIFSDSDVSSSSEDGRTVKPDYRLEKTAPHGPALYPFTTIRRIATSSNGIALLTSKHRPDMWGSQLRKANVGVSAVPATRCWAKPWKMVGEAKFGVGGHFINGSGRH